MCPDGCGPHGSPLDGSPSLSVFPGISSIPGSQFQLRLHLHNLTHYLLRGCTKGTWLDHKLPTLGNLGGSLRGSRTPSKLHPAEPGSHMGDARVATRAAVARCAWMMTAMTFACLDGPMLSNKH